MIRPVAHYPSLLWPALLAAALLVAGCAGNDEEPVTEVQNLQEAYDKARDSIAHNNYSRGIQIFEAIQARYPFSDLSRQIQLELVYAFYKSGQRERAIEASETFIRENPIHRRVDYALYIQGLAHFDGDTGMLERWFRKDMTRRPPIGVEESYATLRRLVERYPASPYAPDARQRLIYLRDRLAQYENHVADWYIRRGAYVAAINRAKAALEQYNGSPSNERSLELLIEAYEALGMEELANDARRVLELNFGKSAKAN
ncbi:MAG: outer membrane protein assembly factor BamD [Pseudomonadota bacterium]